ncbi:hypothetical protein, partial [Paramuribaculum intestinale]
SRQCTKGFARFWTVKDGKLLLFLKKVSSSADKGVTPRKNYPAAGSGAGFGLLSVLRNGDIFLP